jgi:hypothetical protein
MMITQGYYMMIMQGYFMMIMQGYHDDHAGINIAVKRRRMRDIRKWREDVCQNNMSMKYGKIKAYKGTIEDINSGISPLFSCVKTKLYGVCTRNFL